MISRPYTVLIVDPSPDDRAALQQILARDPIAPYRCAEAATAAEGLRRYGELRPDALIFKLPLPDAEPRAFASALLSARGAEASALLALVDADTAPHAAEILALGIHDTLQAGPQLVHQLGRAIAGAITRAALQRELAAMAAERAWLQATLASIGDGVMTINARGKVVALNTEAERLTGWRQADARGQPAATVARMLDRDTRAPVEHLVARAHGQGPPVALADRMVLRRRGGGATPVDVRVVPISRKGDIEGLVLLMRDVLSQTLTEQALHASTLKLENVLASMSDAVFIADVTERFVDFNDAFVTFHRFKTRAECLHTLAEHPAFLDVFLPDGTLAPPAQRVVPRALRGETATNAEYRLRRADTDETWVGSYTFAPIRDPDGVIIGAVVVGRDITARKQAEAELRMQRDRFIKIVETVPGVVCAFRQRPDGSTCFPYASPRIVEIYGVPPEALMQDSAAAAACWHPDDLPQLLASIERSRQQMAPWRHEFRVLHPERGEIWIEGHSLPQQEADGSLIWYGVLTDITARKRAEQALRESEARFRALAESLPQLVWACAPDGTCVYLSAQWVAYTGVPEAVQLGSGWLEQLHPDDRAPTIVAWAAAVAAGADFHSEFRIRRSDGVYRWFDTRALRLCDTAGRLLQWVGSNTDITERREAEQALRRSNRRLQVLADAAHAFAEAGMDYQALLNRVARTVAELLDDSCAIRLISDDGQWLQLVALYDADPAHLQLQRAILGSVPLRTDGSWAGAQIIQSQQPLLVSVVDRAQMRTSTTPALWELVERLGIHSMLVMPLCTQGRVIGTMGLYRYDAAQPPFDREDLALAQDLADRAALAITNAHLLLQTRRSADRLGHLRAIDQAILAEGALVAIAEAAVLHIGQLIPAMRVAVGQYDADTQQVIVLAVQAGGTIQPPMMAQVPLAIFGAASDTLVCGELCAVPDIAALVDRPTFVQLAPPELRAYFLVPIMAGNTLIGLLNAGASTPYAFTAEHIEIARDVAAQISIAIQQSRLRTQVARHAQELEQRVVERTAELTAANKELEAFSYSVSHDLRAPLRAINGFAQIMLEDYGPTLPDGAAPLFRTIRDNARQMGRLIDDLLAFSRLGRQALNLRMVDVAALVRQCLDELGDEMAGRQIDLRIGALPDCRADVALLKQVWLNLLANAIKYTRQRDPAHITIDSQSAQGETVYVVRDNGAGFDMEYADKLFGVFQRMHRAEDYEGTGVGLAIVQRIVHRHGGRVWAEAQVDQGAAFYFTLGRG